MSAPLISVDSSSSLEEAAGVMLTNNIRRLIIKEKDEYVTYMQEFLSLCDLVHQDCITI